MKKLSLFSIFVLFSIQSFAINETSVNSYRSNWELREQKKVGLGVQMGGTSGLLGLLLDLNLEDENGARVSYGQGQGYSTFSIAWKNQMEGEYIAPYTLLGWSRWYNSSGLQAPQSHVLDQLLTASEKSENRFGLDLIEGSLGLQYQELEGEYVGFGVFAHLSLLVSLRQSQIVPHAALGVNYLF